MKKLILLLLLFPLFLTAQIQMSQVSGLIPKLNSKQDTTGLQVAKKITATDTVKWNAKQNQINGIGFVKSSGSTLSYDNSSYYLASNPNGYITNSSLGGYLQLSGGTMTGTQNFPYNKASVRLNSATGGYGAFIDYDTNGSECMGFGVDYISSSFRFKTGIAASSMTGGSFMGVTPDFEIKAGQALVGGNMIWHSGNLTPFSGSYTDLTNKPTIPSQYTDAMARAAQYTANGTTTGLLTSSDFLSFNAKLSSINSSMVTSALGYTPYDAANPSSYITSSALSGYLTTSTGIQNQNSLAQTANSWITGVSKSGSSIIGVSGASGIPLTVQAGSGADGIKIIGRGDNLGFIDFYKNDGTTNIGSVYGATDGLHFSGTALFSSSVSATTFSGSGSNLTGVQKPITLTTTGTSGAATFSGGVLNVPNYSANSTGGTYYASIVNVNGISSSSVTNSMYTSINGIYTVVNRVTLTNNSNSLSFRISLPSSASTTNIVGVSSGDFYITPSITVTYYSSTYATVTCFFPDTIKNAVLDISITYK